MEGDIAHQGSNLCWYQKIRMITLPCGIKISGVRSFISSQSTRVTDGQADRQTDEQRQNYDPQDRASIDASRVKKQRIQYFETITGCPFNLKLWQMQLNHTPF